METEFHHGARTGGAVRGSHGLEEFDRSPEECRSSVTERSLEACGLDHSGNSRADGSDHRVDHRIDPARGVAGPSCSATW